jgi:hypothetical protein
MKGSDMQKQLDGAKSLKTPSGRNSTKASTVYKSSVP